MVVVPVVLLLPPVPALALALVHASLRKSRESAPHRVGPLLQRGSCFGRDNSSRPRAPIMRAAVYLVLARLCGKRV